MNRRTFLQSAPLLGFCNSALTGAQDPPASAYSPWQPGMLDIHHLAYGRGNSTFILCPDGTTILIDAGTTEDSLDLSSAQKPNTAMRPGEWIASYISRHMAPAERKEIDYALLTHIHPDHIGDLGPANPPSPRGNYRLTGISDVDAVVPIRRLLDRGFPAYDYPLPQRAPFAVNYLEYVKSRIRLRQSCQRVQPGRSDQLRLLRQPARYPGFLIRNLAAGGEVWTGAGSSTRRSFPDLRALQREDYPTENMCSVALKIGYGEFSYFTGGDLTCDTEETGEPWHDIETPVAQAAGKVDVAVANHHGYFDAVGPAFVRALQPQVFIVPAWYIAHPTIQPLRRMLSQRLYRRHRDVFATNVMPANRAVNNQYISKLKSLQGHIVVRVAPGGREFRVIVLDNTAASDRVTASFGPYRAG